jgi:ribonuclease P protein component
MTGTNSFGKTERLSSAKAIEKLFKNGARFNNYPVKVYWKIRENQDVGQVKILISVPKKNFAKAVERNLIKRRIREVYRKNKHILLSELAKKNTTSIEIAFIYIGQNIIEYNELENKVISALQSLVQYL